MRMHTHGKWSSNILVGALTVFCVILLYNYWTLSTLNHDLILKVHSLEERIIQMANSNDALQVSLDKVQDIKDKVEGNLRKEQLVDQKAKEELAQKSNKIKSLLNDVENSKQATQNCREELTLTESKVTEKEKDVSESKAKLVSLEARLVEKTNKVSRLEKECQDTKQRLERLVGGGGGGSSSSTTKKSAGDKGLPVPAPAVELAHQDEQPVLINDPAVPFPKGWMEHGSVVIHRLKSFSIKNTGDNGIVRNQEMGPVIIFDPPNQKRVKARFSVLDPPKKNEMKPETVGASPIKHQESLGIAKPLPQAQEDANNNIGNGGEDFGQQPGPGVLQAPGRRGDQPLHGEQNLDAAEDDGDRPFKDDFGQQDDQSPDGALSQKEVINAAIQAPDLKHDAERQN